MRRRFASLLAPLSFVLLGGAGPFEGCESSENPRPLPIDPSASCFFDEDCVPTGCEALRCQAGTCIEVAPIRDGDGDGHAPPPCGMDCNDADGAVAPDRAEICDLRDQDCDERVDAGAAPRAVRFELTTVDPTMAGASWDDRILVSDAEFTARGVRSRRLTIDGRLGTVEPLYDTPRTTVAADAAPTDDGAWVVLALAPGDGTTTTTLVLVRLRREADGSVAADEAAIAHDTAAGVRAVAIVVIDDTAIVAWDDDLAGRRAWSPGWADELLVAESLVEGLGPLEVATDGTNAAVASGIDRLAFLAVADGARVADVALEDDLFPGRPVESGDGYVWVALRSGVARVSTTETGGRTSLPGTGTIQVGIDRVPEGLLITRTSSLGTGAWIVDPESPTEVRQSYLPSDVAGPARAIVGTDVVSTSSGTAILTNFGAAGSSLAVLACGEEG